MAMIVGVGVGAVVAVVTSGQGAPRKGAEKP